MTETWTLPQPWSFTGQTQSDYIAWATEQETAGRRLVVESFYDAYPDGGDANELWLWTECVVSDVHTGAVLYVIGFEDEIPSTPEFESLLVVERLLAE